MGLLVICAMLPSAVLKPITIPGGQILGVSTLAMSAPPVVINSVVKPTL